MRGIFRFHSLSGRLVALFVVMAIAVVVLVGASIASAFRSHFQEAIRPHLLRYIDYVRADIGVPPDWERAHRIARELPGEIYIVDPTRAWSSSGRAVNLDALTTSRRFRANGVEYSFGILDGHDVAVARFPEYTLAFSAPETRDRGYWHILPLTVSLLILAVLYHGTRRLFAPIGTIKDGIERIGAGELAYRLDVRRRDELGELARSINAMADDIQGMLEAKRQLLLAISHELRSPLTRAKVAVELIDDTRQRADLHRDLDEMEGLIEELLETERLNARHAALQRAPVVLNHLVRTLIAEAFAGQILTLHMPDVPIEAEVDAVRLRMLLKNLLDNALRHTPAGAPAPELALEARAAEVVFTVTDYGPGVDAQHLPHLAEAFFRADPARLRATGGYGLGLYLCRMIAQAHGGTLRITSVAGKGIQIEVVLPRSAPESAHRER